MPATQSPRAAGGVMPGAEVMGATAGKARCWCEPGRGGVMPGAEVMGTTAGKARYWCEPGRAGGRADADRSDWCLVISETVQ